MKIIEFPSAEPLEKALLEKRAKGAEVSRFSRERGNYEYLVQTTERAYEVFKAKEKGEGHDRH